MPTPFLRDNRIKLVRIVSSQSLNQFLDCCVVKFCQYSCTNRCPNNGKVSLAVSVSGLPCLIEHAFRINHKFGNWSGPLLAECSECLIFVRRPSLFLQQRKSAIKSKHEAHLVSQRPTKKPLLKIIKKAVLIVQWKRA